MTLLDAALTAGGAWAAALGAAHLACIGFNILWYRRGPAPGAVAPMTVIKPLRGADEGLEENLAALLQSDAGGALEVLFAVESADDPAAAAASRAMARVPGRDARLVVTGPSGERMGKIHNMIEALKQARHPVVVFSDADVRADAGLLAETTRAFAEGTGAVGAVPYCPPRGSLGEIVVGFCFNHYFVVPAALLHRAGIVHAFAGAWMAFRADVLGRLGGLEPFARHIADDFAVGQAAVRAGAKARLLRRVAEIREPASSLADALRHAFKWMRVIRYAAPAIYVLLPLCNPLAISAVVCAAAFLLKTPPSWPLPLLAALAASRAAGAWLQDRAVLGRSFPAWSYSLVPAGDLVSLATWALAAFGNTVTWRGRRYRLRNGGRVEVL